MEVFAELPYREPPYQLPYRMRVCALNTTCERCRLLLYPSSRASLARPPHTVVVPGFEPHGRTLDPAVLSSLRRAHARGARMISICVGAFAIAQARMLNGRSATTHWPFAGELASRYRSGRTC